ncbi:unnamed protein product [Rotaria socialis]|uniref:HAT C-terminal dimerisation domain-containing protein n=1 Tax=Rotaria socialis TaxID=392032 RepID=A0A820YT19_9BILA|nr:unnamed protein product [Rotaria socialis]
MDNQSEDSIMSTSSIEAEQEIMAVTITTQTTKTPVSPPYFTCKILDEVSKARFYSISFDASNKGNTKTCPFVIQYLSDVGVKRDLINFLEDSREAALDIFKNIIKAIDDHQLNIYKLTSIGPDNANANFGEYHSVFKLLKVVYRIFLKVLLQHINIRWLSLLPSIERLIETYEPLKLYFLNDQTKTKKLPAATDNTQLLTSFFNNPDGLCTLKFLENVLVDIQQVELNLQRTWTTAVDLYRIITNLMKKLEQRLNDKYFGTVIEYINFCLEPEKKFYETLSVLNSQSIYFFKWDKNVHNSQSTTNNNYEVLCAINDTEKDDLLNKDQDSKEHIQSDQLWAYLLNIRPNTTPNMKLIISYVFSIPCSNAYVESIFSHMNHLWSDYRNRMDIELVAAELKIRKNADIPSSNEKLVKKKCIIDK